jgi:hypothetical protein
MMRPLLAGLSLALVLRSPVTRAAGAWDRAASLVDRWRAGAVDTASLAVEAGRIPWPLLPAEVERAVADAAANGSVDGAWAADRLLPVLAGELPAGGELLDAMLGAVGRTAAPTLDGLSQARRAYADGRPAEAVARYRSLEGTSEVWREAAWAHYAAGDGARALGAGVTLVSPWLPAEDHAEGRLSSAMVMRDHCRFDEARRLVAPLAEVPPAEPPGNLLSLVLSREAASNAVVRDVRDAPLVRRLREVFEAAGAPASDAGDAIRRASLEPASAAVRRTWDAVVEARRHIAERAAALRYDTLRAERDLRAEGWTPEAATPVTLPPLDDDEVVWGFEGVWWRDELGLYRSIAATLCPRVER